jgi:hypothetical protein
MWTRVSPGGELGRAVALACGRLRVMTAEEARAIGTRLLWRQMCMPGAETYGAMLGACMQGGRIGHWEHWGRSRDSGAAARTLALCCFSLRHGEPGWAERHVTSTVYWRLWGGQAAIASSDNQNAVKIAPQDVFTADEAPCFSPGRRFSSSCTHALVGRY